MKDKELIKKIKEWLSDNIKECLNTPENISLKEENKILLKFINENENDTE